MKAHPPRGASPTPRGGRSGTTRRQPPRPNRDPEKTILLPTTKTHPLERNPTMTTKPRGIAARAGHWSARHRKTAIFGWLALMIALAVFGGSLGQKTPTDAQKLDGDSRRAATIVEDAGFPEKSGEMVLVQSKSKTAGDKDFKAAVKDVSKSLTKVPGVADAKSDTVTADKHSVLVDVRV